jgi:ribosomal-protein-alanine N-acetyltransferase
MEIAAALAAAIPTLESDRLRYRAFGPSDFEPMAAFFADEVSRFYGGPCDRETAWRKFAAYAGHWSIRGYGPWAVERKDSGAFIGIVGPWNPEGWVEREITWALMPGHHGHGFATEAAATTLRAAYELLGWTTAISVIAQGNVASSALAERLGATIERQIDFRGATADVWRHQPPV